VVRERYALTKVSLIRTLGAAVLVTVVVLLTGCGGGSGGSSIVGVLWEWNGLQETHPAHLSAVPDPQNYLLLLNKDGSFEAKADCNQLHGTYTLSGGNLTLTHGPMTMAQCAPSSLSDKSTCSARSRLKPRKTGS
jgi:heat shock protein HslJ